jgi:deoxycytidylate deaminase
MQIEILSLSLTEIISELNADLDSFLKNDAVLEIIAKLQAENAALLTKNKELEEELKERKAFVVANPCEQCGGKINAMACVALQSKVKELEAKLEIACSIRQLAKEHGFEERSRDDKRRSFLLASSKK